MRKSQLLVEYTIFFLPKKNEILCLYINYQKLNNIIIKNRYLLLNINKFQNKLLNI